MRFSPRLRPELAALLLLAGCGGAGAPPQLAPLPAVPGEDVEVLDESAITALADLLRMEDERTLTAARIRELASGDSRELRGRALLAIGRLRDRSLGAVVLGGLADGSALVRARAAFALGLLADSSEAAVTALRAVLFDHTAIDPRPAIEAAAALGRIGTAAAFDALIERVTADTTSPDAAGTEALLHLWRAPRSPRVAGAVAPHLRSPDPRIRWNAAYALARPGGHLAIEPLLPLAADTSADVRALAMRALRAPAADSAGYRAPAHDVLRAALTDAHPHVRINALAAIATYADPGDRGTVEERLADEDGNVRIAALQALGEMGAAESAARLATLVRDTSERHGIRAAALAALVRVDARQGRAVALEWASSAEWLMRLQATRALVTVRPDPVADDALLERARDPDPRVAAAALRAVADSAHGPAVNAVLIERLASADPMVRAAAVAGLARSPGGADLALLMEAYERARHDTVPTAALAVIDALAGLEERSIPAARSFFLRFPPSDDPRVRRRVADRLGDGWQGTAAPPRPTRPDAFYRDVVASLMVPVLTGEARPRVAIGTDHGEIVIALAPDHAPLTVLNFLTLVRRGYYEGDDYGGYPGLRWHRVVPNFVLQDGDPRGDGAGGPGHTIRDELNRLRYLRGAVGMALSGPDTGGGQYFITHSPQPHLDAGYTIFGRVVAGMDVADRIIQDDPIRYIREVR